MPHYREDARPVANHGAVLFWGLWGQASGRQISVSKSSGATSIGVLRYTSNTGLSAGVSPDCGSQLR